MFITAVCFLLLTMASVFFHLEMFEAMPCGNLYLFSRLFWGLIIKLGAAFISH